MGARSSIVARMRAWAGRERLDRELTEEIRQHLELRRESLIASGMDPREAEYEARRRFGNVTRIREETRTMWGFPSFDMLMQDVRFGARQLRRSPMFTAVAVLSLAIGIGSTSAVFTLADLVLFRKLPVRNPDELVIFRWISGPVLAFDSLNGNGSQGETENSSTSFSLAAFQRLRDGGTALADIVGFADMYRINLGIDGDAELATGQAVSGNYFDVLGVAPVLGRPLLQLDDRREAAPVAMIAHGFWQRRFGGAMDVVGRSITINSLPVTIVGVTPRGFRGAMQVADAPAVFVPLASLARFERTETHFDPNHWWVLMLGRLKPGISSETARPTLDALLKQTIATHRPGLAATDLPRLTLLPGARGQLEQRDGSREPLLIMAAVAAIVLLVACANIANLLLARAHARGREIAVRLSLGAPRWRVVRQLLTESLLLGLIASAVALAVMASVARLLMPALDQGDPFLIDVGVDARAVAFTLATASFTAMIFGLFPAVRGTAPRFVSGLQEAGRRVVGGAHRVGATGALVSAQIALSLILVSIAGLLTATVRNLDRVSPGFDPSNLLLFRIDPTLNGYEGSRLTALYGALLERIRAVPGVASATVSAHTLIANSGSISEVYLPGDGAGEPAVSVGSERRAASRRRPLAWRQAIDDEYFRTMSIPVLAGRTFDHGETVQSRKAAMVNSTFVRQVLDGRDPIGRRFSFSGRPNAPEYEIVGVVGDARISSIRDDVPVTVYVSYRQHAPGAMTFEVRTTGDPLSIVPSVRQAVSEADPNVPMFDVRTQAMQIAHSLRREHLFARLATMLSLVTLLLSGIGLYGLLAHWVTRRTAEIGVRMALGAARATVRWMVLRQSILLVILGLAVGVPAALAGSQLVRSLLFGLNPTDPVTIAGAAGLLVLVALAAAYLPARRASCVDPMVALRQL